MGKKVLRIILALLSIFIGLYPALYFILDRKFGLLSTKSDALLADTCWNIGFYTHIIPGGLALLTGWTQFNPALRDTRPALHKQIGKSYVVFVLMASLAGIYIGFYATGGPVASLGFICLGLIWFYTTLRAYRHIKNGRIDPHERMMTYSYAACFAAVTLRLWLPFLTAVLGDFMQAYRIVAWLCWVPNLIVARFITRKSTFAHDDSAIIKTDRLLKP